MAWRLQSATASSASELKDLAHQTKKKTNQKDGAGQHSKEQTNSIGKLYHRVKPEQQKGGQTAMTGPGGP